MEKSYVPLLTTTPTTISNHEIEVMTEEMVFDN
jgi:hypothetical protein